MFTPQKNSTNFFLFVIIIFWLLSSCNNIQDENTIGFEAIDEMYDYNIHDRLFDDNWKFFKGKADGAENSSFEDTKWRILDLPHDWSI